MKSLHPPPEFRESKSQTKRMFEHTRPQNEPGQMENRCPGIRNDGRSSRNHLESILKPRTNKKSQQKPENPKIEEFSSLLSRDTGAVCIPSIFQVHPIWPLWGPVVPMVPMVPDIILSIVSSTTKEPSMEQNGRAHTVPCARKMLSGPVLGLWGPAGYGWQGRLRNTTSHVLDHF